MKLEESIKKLEDNDPSLTSLDLSKNRIISSDIAKKIATALRRNTKLKELSLWKCQIGDEGIISIADSLKINTTLISINLFGCNASIDSVTAIIEALKVNKTVTHLSIGIDIWSCHPKFNIINAIELLDEINLLLETNRNIINSIDYFILNQKEWVKSYYNPELELGCFNNRITKEPKSKKFCNLQFKFQ